MFDRLKIILVFGIVLSLCSWIGLKVASYFTHTTNPIIYVKGLEDAGTYARQIECSVNAHNTYKIGNVIVSLDGTTILDAWPKARQINVPFSIDTTELNDGQHTLIVTAIDSSYNRNKTVQSYAFTIDNTPLRAVFVDQDYTVDQGKTLHIKLHSNKILHNAVIKIFGREHNFYPETEGSTTYESFIPVDAEERAQEVVATTNIEDLVKNKQTLSCKITVQAFPFKKQKGFSVESDLFAQEKDHSLSMKVLKDAMEKWLLESPKKKLWSGPFEYPIDALRMTTPYGEIRMTPERGRYMHKGIDLVNHPKCVVWAAQTGKVIIKDRFVIPGNTIVLDHGLGVFSLYGHLEDFADVQVGDIVKKGNPLGRLGKTGYASGYHLHWEILINNISIDPVEWTTTVY